VLMVGQHYIEAYYGKGVDTNLAPAVINPAAAKASAAVAPSAEAEPSLKMDFPEDETK
jgi:polar amino acid transport system permease protein